MGKFSISILLLMGLIFACNMGDFMHIKFNMFVVRASDDGASGPIPPKPPSPPAPGGPKDPSV